MAWNNQNLISNKLEQLRENQLSRKEAYLLFHGENSVPGIGPAYFTKLLYFFSPEPTHYIMDQHTAKSVNLLNNMIIVRMQGNAVSNLNRPGHYQAYCEEVDAMAQVLECNGEQAEERLMSRGVHHPWPWRAYMREHWPPFNNHIEYCRNLLHQSFPHIDNDDF